MKRARVGTRLLAPALIILTCSVLSSAEDTEPGAKPQPEAEFRSPEDGEEVSHTFTARGRTRNIPDGFVVMLFMVVPASDFLFPAAEAFRGNRTFSETIYHDISEKGPRSLELHMLPEEPAEKLTAWREAYLKWLQKGKEGPEPEYDPSWMTDAEGITAVGYTLKD
jgi:hypothetical protein